MTAAIHRGEWTDPLRAQISVEDWPQQWLTSKSPSLKATTRESYRSLLSTCILPRWGRALVARNPQRRCRWAASLSDHVGPSRCRKAVTLLSGIMAAAVRDQRITRNPCQGVSLPRLPAQRQRFLSLDELRTLADAAGEDGLMIMILGLCGLRFGECAALRVRSVDLLRRRLRVTESVTEVNGHLVWSTPKTHQSRDVPVLRSLADVLTAQISGKTPRRPAVLQPAGRSDSARQLAETNGTPPLQKAGYTICDRMTCGTRPRHSPSPPEHPSSMSSACSGTRTQP